MNLTHGSWNLIQHFRQNDNYIVIDGDKHLGPCILDRSVYFQRGCKEHLGNKSNYRALTKEGALNRQRGLQIKLRYFISKFRPRDPHQESPDYVCISKVEDTFLRRALKNTLLD